MNVSSHRQKQREVVALIEKQVRSGSINFSTVGEVEDYENDPRMTLTSVHFPNLELVKQLKEKFILPLSKQFTQPYYYPDSSLHMTIKNIRVVNDPPTFNARDVEKAKIVLEKVIPRHKKFNVYFEKLILFPKNLSLVGTTDPELDEIILDLDRELKTVSLEDDKKYVNDKYFFSNITVARFYEPVSNDFKSKVEEFSQNINFQPYTVGSVSLIICNAVLSRNEVVGEWRLG